MSTMAPPDLDALRKASRIAGAVTLAGVIFVLGSIGYSVWRLADTERDLAELHQKRSGMEKDLLNLKGEYEQLQVKKEALDREIKGIADRVPDPLKGKSKQTRPPIQRIGDAVEERAELERQVVALRKEAQIIRQELEKSFRDPARSIALWAKPEYRGVMTAVLVRPRSEYIERNDPNSPTGKWYHFRLMLEFPTNPELQKVMKQTVRSVTYDLNHPYLKIEPKVSKDSGKNFAVEHEGAGTLRNVVIKVDLGGNLVVPLDYDMTKAHPQAAKK